MSGLPDVTITGGTLTADPEIRFTAGGSPVANFTVACNKRVYNRDTDQWEDRDATFLRCSIWNQAAEHVSESLTKGMRVNVHGELRQRSYETREGEKRTVFEVDVFEVGPSLKFATAKVAKANRGGGKQAPADDPWGSAPASDPWASAPPTGGSFSDEPPF